MNKNLKPAISKSAMMLRNMYDLYAKMLAVENIQVVFDEAIDAPAQFDILNRILYIAPVHATQVELIPGLVIHEVGHALFSTLTPEELKKLKRISKLLNIIDDGYQERMMCKKYANSKKHLFTIFDHFFLQLKEDVYNTPNKLVNIVNILNFNCKGFKHGHYKKYPSYVLEEDVKLLQEAEQIALPKLIERDEFAKKLAQALKKYGDMAEDGTDLDSGKGKDSKSGPTDKGEPDDADGESEDGESEDGESGESGDDADDESDQTGAGGNGAAEDDVEEMLEKNSDKLNDHHKKFEQNMGGAGSYELPTGKEILDFSRVIDIYEKDSQVDRAIANAGVDIADKYRRCQKEAKRVATQIFTKFNMRLQAQNYANTQFKKSGSLDPERCALYQVYDDVFVKEAIEPNQVNNAYSVILDWSGSMNSSVYALVLRIMELTYFAKMANVEIEVWMYTTNDGAVSYKGCRRNIALTNSKMIKVLNTKQHNQLETETRLKHLWYITRTITNMSPKLQGIDGYTSRYTLSGTNILEGLILGHYVLSKMDAEKKACFLLTDGDDTSVFNVLYRADGGPSKNYAPDAKIYLHGINVSQAYKRNHVRASSSAAIAELYAAAGQKTIGIAWNCQGAAMDGYAHNVIRVSTGAQVIEDGYIHAPNVFVDEVVKNLL